MDQLQDERAPFAVRDLHHEDVALMSNLKLTPESVFFLHLCNLRPIRRGHARRHNFKERKIDLQSKSN
jgi:hypothetical protein